MGKLIIMAANAQGMPGGGAPVPPSDIHNLSTLIQIFRTLGGVTVLEATTESHAEEIKQLTQQVYAIPFIIEDVAQNTKDLKQLEKRHTEELTELERQVNGLGGRQTKDLNDLGIRLGNAIGDLKGKMDTAENIFRIFLGALAVIVTVFGPPLLYYLWHHFTITFKP